MSRQHISKVLDLECPFEATSEEASKGAHDGHEQGYNEGVAQKGEEEEGVSLGDDIQQRNIRDVVLLKSEHVVSLTFVGDLVCRLVQLKQK